ncbi:MAG: L,D-transpeptidase [Devosiaceae bacterium]|nr:L,D-transpeptidase [Devosiaceae bacterium]
MTNKTQISRRVFTTGGISLLGLTLAGCSNASKTGTETEAVSVSTQRLALMYGPLPEEKFPIPAIHLRKLDKRFYRQQVDFDTSEKVGTIIVNTKTFYCHLIQENGKAMRYGVGLGKAGFEWSGRAQIAWKRKWPTWTPPASMIERVPELEKYSAANGGQQPGLDNPLGARALYVYKNGRDTLYRLHGSVETYSIGKAVSSGCVRFINQDIVDLYDRIPRKAPLLVI